MPSSLDLVKNAISPNRMGTYEQIKGISKPGLVRPLALEKALELYAWNAEISACFMHPLHVCEVVVRNGVSNVLETVYGPQWPWSSSFEQSLPNPKSGYSMKKDLRSARAKHSTTGKVIPELKFAFWQKLFTSRHDKRLWDNHLLSEFPNFPAGMQVSDCRKLIFDSLDRARALRNRIAHHEPIFARDLFLDFDTVQTLIDRRCSTTSSWMVAHQQVSRLLVSSPI